MNSKKSIALLGALLPLLAANAITVSNGPVVPGEWNSNFLEARELAAARHVPMLVFWGSTECGYCDSLKRAVTDADFLAWQSARQLIMVQCNDRNSDNAKECFEFSIDRNDPNNYYPRIVVLWEKSDGTRVEERFAGRENTMPVRTGTLAQRFMSSVDHFIAGWSGVPDSGYVPTAPASAGGKGAVASVFSKARNYQAVVRDATGIRGLLTLKVGKGNRSGVSSVGGKFTSVQGKNYSIKSVRVVTDAWPVNCPDLSISKFGTLSGVSIAESGSVSGSLDGAEVSAAASVGVLSEGTHHVALTAVPEIPNAVVYAELLPDVDFSVVRGKWVFEKASRISYKDMRLTIVDSGNLANRSGIKLTISAKTGIFKGKFQVYGLVNGRLKKYAAKVSGIVADGVGSAQALINKVYYPMEIK